MNLFFTSFRVTVMLVKISESKKNEGLKSLISTKAKKLVNESVT